MALFFLQLYVKTFELEEHIKYGAQLVSMERPAGVHVPIVTSLSTAGKTSRSITWRKNRLQDHTASFMQTQSSWCLRPHTASIH